MTKIIVKNKQHLLELLKDVNLDLSSLDISELDDLSEVFKDSKRENFSGISTWNTSKVKNMRGMFAYAKHFNENINDWCVRNVSDMSSMFRGTPFNQPLDKWDTNSLENIESIFLCAKHFNQNINSWNVSKVKDMSHAFMFANSFNQSLDRWKVDCKNVNCDCMFVFSSFNQDLSSWKNLEQGDVFGKEYLKEMSEVKK